MLSTGMDIQLEIIPQYVSMIREENSIDEKVKLLEDLNRLLPEGTRLSIPSLITNDYVSKAVNIVEEAWLQGRWRHEEFVYLIGGTEASDFNDRLVGYTDFVILYCCLVLVYDIRVVIIPKFSTTLKNCLT